MTPSFFEAAGQPDSAGPADQEPTGRRGRRPAPIGDEVGIAHRGWLLPSRRLLNASGMTLDHLAERVNYSKPRLSQLLGGKDRYPRWEITSRVGSALGMPLPPMRRQWISGAVEAGKKRSWIEACLQEVHVADQRQPLPLRALQDAMREPYTDYAGVFLLNSKRAGFVVSETFDVLWMCWLLATSSPNTNRFAWSLLRARVLPRAPRNPDGSINMSMAALFTQAYAAEATCEESQAQLQESVELFDAISRMPHNPMDTSVLRYLCGQPDDKIPDIIGVSPTLAEVFDLHARQILEVDLAARTHPGGITP